MSITPDQLAIFSLALLALGLMAGAGALIAAELRRTRSGKVIDRAIQQVVTAPRDSKASVDSAEEPNAPAKPDIELPFHWLDSRIGRCLLYTSDAADE